MRADLFSARVNPCGLAIARGDAHKGLFHAGLAAVWGNAHNGLFYAGLAAAHGNAHKGLFYAGLRPPPPPQVRVLLGTGWPD